jgi:hypothetical protein
LKTIDYNLNIQGLKTKKGTISISALKEIMEALLKGSDKVLRLLIEGRSVIGGKNPEWLKKSLDFTISGIKAGSTIIELEAPLLKKTIPEQLTQKKLWDDIESIKPDDTAVSLLSRSFADASAENMESNYFDVGVLDALLSFNPIIKKYAKELIITSNKRAKDNFRISSEQIEKIKKIKIETPKPQTIVISGFFNLIEHSNQRFQLIVEEDKKIDGIMDPSFVNIENMRELWGKRVTIKGKANYKPSGKIRNIEAQLIRPFESGDEILQKIPGAQRRFKFVDEFLLEKNANTALKKVWGKWPGDESIDDLLAAL